MGAQEIFIDRLSVLNSTLSTESLSERPPTEIEHNQMALILRNGLAVVGFAALEDFIKSRTSEILSLIGTSTSIPFDKLPPKLQSATTFDSINAISFQLSLLDSDSAKLSYVLDSAIKIASTQNTNYNLIEHAYGYSQSNVNHETIKTILGNFQIDNPWVQMTKLASRLNLVALPLEETFKNASRRRHKAAHVAHASTPLNDLRQFVKEAFAVAVSFDCLISNALYKIKVSDSDYLNQTNPRKIKESDINFRFIKFDNKLWKEYPTEKAVRAYRKNADFNLIQPNALIRAQKNLQTLVSFNSNGLISKWDC